MRCEQIQSLLSAFADGELGGRAAGRVSDHLAICATCAADARALRRLVTALHELPDEEPPVALHAAILSALTTARPSVWQRLSALTVPVYPLRHLAVGAAAAGFAVLALSTSPVHQGTLPNASTVHLPFTGPSRPIAALPPETSALPSVESDPLKATLETTVTPPTARTAPVVLASGTHAIVKPWDAPPRMLRAAVAPSRRPVGRSVARKPSEKQGNKRNEPAPMATFDPLAPVLDPNGARAEPQMANVVVVDNPMPMPSPEAPAMPTTPGGVELATVGATDHDPLLSLRQRLAQEELQIPTVQFKPRPRKSKKSPIVFSDF